MQVVYELLTQYPEAARIPDDEGHLPIEIAADKAFDPPSSVMDLVLEMLDCPGKAAKLAGHAMRSRQLRMRVPSSGMLLAH